MANTLTAARSARVPAAAEHLRSSAGASTSFRNGPKTELITRTEPNARLRRHHQQNGAATSRRHTLTRTRTGAASAVEFADNSHLAFYEQQQPSLSLDMGMKSARKLAKKIGKQKKSLTKLASAIQLSSSALQPVLAELDSALEQVQERVAQLEKEAGIDSDSSSSDSSDDERTTEKQDETDAARIAGRLEERRNVQEGTSACASAVVGAMSVETRPETPEGRFFVCQGKHCKKRGGEAVLEAVSSRAAMLGDSVQVTPTGCLGQCKKGSCLRVNSGKNKPEFISRIDTEHVDDIFEYALNVRPSEFISY